MVVSPVEREVRSPTEEREDLSTGRLIRRSNGEVFLTPRGKRVEEYLRLDTLIRNHFDPKVAFSMSADYTRQCEERIIKLEQILGMPEKHPENTHARRQRVRYYREVLGQNGFLFHRILSTEPALGKRRSDF